MLKFKFAKSLVLGMCLTIAFSGAVYASDDKTSAEAAGQVQPAAASTMLAPDTAVSSPAYPGLDIPADLLNRQREIDQFVFEQHRGEFAEKGFSVTHTGPMADYVEIGIEPYSEASAEYLYGIFGKEKVKVVEGQLAVALAATSGGAEPALDTPLSAPVGGVVADVSITSSESGDKGTEESASSNTLLYGIGAVVVLGAGAFGIKRILPQKK
ncbi:hypothetical protein Desdi_0889 [Desulfitobacterium dichloroeliminans LMG P-21439]|uniref:Uncharacterized protein n=1 Tax=Desulfitobacterium dichloroeliminans (strain LMG P-21439 / DCA1) TaxID=871963 RepID=L0F5E8_DESDL|nr:hypothetical protein [Desulfitobacterium dichloroeliminans]AGA68412.1 hypothetical protein Desdi_0889 [Desulfitobacterium dichloroeliminans LMG P-21439]